VPALLPQRFTSADIFKPFPKFGASFCEKEMAGVRNEGLFTPPSTQGTLLYPMTGGGVNWGGAAFDPVNQILYTNVSRAMQIVTLIPRTQAEGFKPPKGVELGRQLGAAYAMTRRIAMSPLGILCNKPPWGEMVAVDLKAGKILWRSSVGTSEGRAPLGLAFNWGTPLVNGVVVTAGGLVFTGAVDSYLRAFDAKSGAELWQGRLPVPGIANPMTYLWKGEQYVAIAAGGHSEIGTKIGDSLVAFRLARPGEAPSLWSRTIDRPGGRFMAKALAAAVGLVLLLALIIAALRRRRRRGKSNAGSVNA
jgi:quinoprotein glucose dehydrogenase